MAILRLSQCVAYQVLVRQLQQSFIKIIKVLLLSPAISQPIFVVFQRKLSYFIMPTLFLSLKTSLVLPISHKINYRIYCVGVLNV